VVGSERLGESPDRRQNFRQGFRVPKNKKLWRWCPRYCRVAATRNASKLRGRPKPTTLGTLDPIRGLNRWRQPTLQVVAISQQSRLTETGSPHAGLLRIKAPVRLGHGGLDDRREWHLLLTMGHARFFIARTPKLVLRILVPRPKFANDCREQRCRY
jgi:hypothetical protein